MVLRLLGVSLSLPRNSRWSQESYLVVVVFGTGGLRGHCFADGEFGGGEIAGRG